MTRVHLALPALSIMEKNEIPSETAALDTRKLENVFILRTCKARIFRQPKT